MARWLRGFLPLGILAIPANGDILPGDGTYANDDIWIAFCTKHKPIVVVGDLTPHEDEEKRCEDGHPAVSVMLRQCVKCEKVVAFEKAPGVPKCREHGADPPPILEGEVDDQAAMYKTTAS